MKKKRIILILSVTIVFIALLFPVRFTYKDGGTKEYKAILYSVKLWHSINENYDSGFYEATEIQIFPFNYFS